MADVKLAWLDKIELGLGVAPFSIIKWLPFSLSIFSLERRSGSLFRYQMAPFSIDKNKPTETLEKVYVWEGKLRPITATGPAHILIE